MTENAQQLTARLDRLPIWPYKRRILFFIGVGFFFGFFDIITIGLSLPVIKVQFGLSGEAVSWAITTSLIGYIIGSFLDSRISDYFGRRVALFLSISFYSIGSILSATSSDFMWLLIWRAVIGMGIGAEISEVTTYMSEMSPAPLRGRMSSWAIGLGFLGFAVVPFIGMALVPNYPWGWRVLFAIGGVGGGVILYMRRNLPATVRWLLLQQRLKEAEKIVDQAEACTVQRTGKSLPPINESVLKTAVASTRIGLKEIFISPYCGRLILFILIWFFYYLGNYAWLSLNTTLFVDHGFNLQQSIGFVAINSLGFVFGSSFAILLGDKFERKYLCFLIAMAWTGCILMVAWIPTYSIIMAFGFLAALSISLLIPFMYIYTAENFPTRIRATSVALTDGLGHIGGAICGQVILGIYFIFKARGYGCHYQGKLSV